MEVLTKLNIESLEVSPMFKTNAEIVGLDLSSSNKSLDPAHPEHYVLQATDNFKKMGIGGYLEKRRLYEISDNFKDETFRNIHLGIDVWYKAETPIHAPLKGVIHSYNNNHLRGDYGPTIILQHDINHTTFYTLYGHLSLESLHSIKLGQEISAGERFCWIGNNSVNGGWTPHLHFQVIRDMQGKRGDYPGVAHEKNLDFYRVNCPDPAQLIRFA